MSSLVDALTVWQEKLASEGVRATLDPRNVNPPCVLLTAPAVVLDVSCGGTATFTAYALTRGPANADAWLSLDELVTKVAAVVPLESFEPGSYAVDDTSPLPCFTLTWTEALTWP
jgi:hypothetical protein